MMQNDNASVDAIAAGFGVEPEYVLEIEVFLEVIYSKYLEEGTAVSEITPFYDAKGIRNQNAFREFEDFIVNILGLFSALGFKDVEYDISRKSGTSHYFTFYSIDKQGNAKEKQLIILRISDHDRAEGMNEEEWRAFQRKQSTENQATADRYKEKFGKRINQVWAFKNIIINKKEYKSYDDALDEVERYLRTKSDAI